jgi:molybdenum cofactor cytidylyltransferase
VSWALEQAAGAGLEHTWVVTGALDLVAEGLVPPGVEVLVNRRWKQGLASSLQLAVATARALELDAVVVGLGDQPLVPASAWRAVAASSGRPVAVASYAGRNRNPVRLDRAVWDLLPDTGDEGARAVIAGRPELVMAVACDGDPADIDTVEDLAAWS